MIMDTFQKEFTRLEPVIMGYPWDDKKAYAIFLAQVFHFVKHSSRIMSTVAAHLPQEMEQMHTQLLKHATEEMGHQFLAKQDLKYLGHPLEGLPELASTRMFYEPQYFKAIHGNPIGFYGYALALEGTAVMRLKQIYSRCKELYGEKACNFLRVHAEEDENHVEAVIKLLEQLPPPAIQSIEVNLSQSIDAIVLMFAEMKKASAAIGDAVKKAA